MRTLTAFLCLTFAVLLFSAGEAWSLPKCPGSYNQNTWTNCFGTATYTDGKKYVGEWRGGKRHGQGTITLSDGSGYAGEWRDSKQHGQGTETYSNGNKYIGEWRDGKKHGQGTATYANGDKYVGEWRAHRRHGQGTFTYANGDKSVNGGRTADTVRVLTPMPMEELRKASGRTVSVKLRKERRSGNGLRKNELPKRENRNG